MCQLHNKCYLSKYLSNPSATRAIFKWSLTDLNLEFSLSKSVAIPTIKKKAGPIINP